MSSVKKTIARVVATERARAQAKRPSLFDLNPAAVNRSATRMPLRQHKGTRGVRARAALADQ